MSGTSNTPLIPTYTGIVKSTKEALVLFEACLNARLNHVPRRPHDRERGTLIKSGHIFIYEEHASGIKRWTDGINWSPSRILGNFLVYRELDNKVQPGEKKRALKHKSPQRRPNNGAVSKSNHSQKSSFNSDHFGPTTPDEKLNEEQLALADERDPMRALVGSLTDSYEFKDPHGLVKKTISVKVNGVTHHLVNYYTIEHAMSGALQSPLSDPRFFGMTIRQELYNQTCFRTALTADYWDDNGNGYVANTVGPAPPANALSHHITGVNGHMHGMIPRQFAGHQPFDGFGQAHPAQLGQFPSQFTGQMNGHLPGSLPMPTSSSFDMPMTLGSTYHQTHSPNDYQPSPALNGHFESNFTSPPIPHPNGGFKVEPQDESHNFADTSFGSSHSANLPNGGSFMDDQFGDYGPDH